MLIDRSLGFQRLYKNEWRVLVSSASLRSLADNKFNKTDMLPLTSDLLKVRSHCIDRISELSKELSVKSDLDNYRKLCETVVTKVTIFNKRRGNEVSSVLLSRYMEREDRSKSLHEDIMSSLSPLEKK